MEKAKNEAPATEKTKSEMPAPAKAPQKKEQKLTSKRGKLQSNITHPVTVDYGGSKIRVSPLATIESIEKDKLGVLPTGVNFIEQN